MEHSVSDYIFYNTEADRKVICQVTNLRSTPYKGFHGKFTILEALSELPKVWTYLYLLHQKMEGYIEIGVTEKTAPVKFRVNPFFRHVLLAGKTGKGKTHVQIVMEEEFLKHGVPSIVIDTQGEFVHLSKFSSKAVVLDDLDFEDLLSYLQLKKTVVYNFQGLSYPDKAQRCYEILSKLKEAKESDYKQAENDVKLLRIPPVIVDIDETEVYAPEPRLGNKFANKDCRNCIIDIAKRRGKEGIGLVVSSQRLPGLHYDVRSQCNSAMAFQITDSGSRNVLSQLPYIGSHELKRVKNLSTGQCLVTGELVPHPLLVHVRDIQTPRAKDLNFERMLGLIPLPKQELELPTEGELRQFQEAMKEGITFEQLEYKFPIREVPIHGKCLVIPERRFNPDWTATLEIQGCRVVHCPDMPGGSVYLVRKNSEKENLRQIKTMAKHRLPRDTSKLPYRD